jgi:hypothetical protein
VRLTALTRTSHDGQRDTGIRGTRPRRYPGCTVESTRHDAHRILEY